MSCAAQRGLTRLGCATALRDGGSWLSWSWGLCGKEESPQAQGHAQSLTAAARLTIGGTQEWKRPTSSGASMVVPSMPTSPAASPFLLGTTLNARGLTFLARIMALHAAHPACVSPRGPRQELRQPAWKLLVDQHQRVLGCGPPGMLRHWKLSESPPTA